MPTITAESRQVLIYNQDFGRETGVGGGGGSKASFNVNKCEPPNASEVFASIKTTTMKSCPSLLVRELSPSQTQL